MGSKFHYRDGWYFERLDDGTVVISRDDSMIVVIDPDSWTSIIAHLSYNGENAFTFAKAQEFHNG